MTARLPDTHLNRLVDDVKRRNGWDADADVIRAAAASGVPLHRHDLASLRHNVNRTIVPSTVKALAAALGVHPFEVAVAVLADHDIVGPAGEVDIEAALAHDPTLSMKARSFIAAIIREDRGGGAGRGDGSRPKRGPPSRPAVAR